MSLRVLHLTHTDLRYDNRILKEMQAISEGTNSRVCGIGVFLNENAAYSKQNFNAEIINLKLFSSKMHGFARWFSYTFLLFELSIRLFLKSLSFKPQVVHCHDTMVLPVGVLLKICFRSILIYDAHELESDKNGQSRILAKATLILEKISWSRIDHLISVSNSIINWYNTNFKPKPAVLILNAPAIIPKGHLSQQKYPENYFKIRYNIDHEALIFVYVGLLGKGRSIETLLRVFSDDSINSHIVFVGYGELHELISKASFAHARIHLHNAVPHEEVVEIIRSADVGLCLIENVSLSDYYCLPNKLFEYTFAGLRILASDIPELRSAVFTYNLGKCSNVEFDSLLNSISNLEKEPIGEVSLNIHELSWEEQALRLCNLYNDLIKLKLYSSPS